MNEHHVATWEGAIKQVASHKIFVTFCKSQATSAFGRVLTSCLAGDKKKINLRRLMTEQMEPMLTGAQRSQASVLSIARNQKELNYSQYGKNCIEQNFLHYIWNPDHLT
jgi:hypothetical protein